MHIPKGATVIASTWWVRHFAGCLYPLSLFLDCRSIVQDETKYYEPHLFKPERFLPKPEGLGEEVPSSAVFGRGRR
jgi:hypothetical protein